MVPGLEAYVNRLPESSVDGGYYTKTAENRPLIGPSGVDGVHLLAGLSGFGVMVSAGAADLLARHVVGAELPDYAGSFLLERYDDPRYLADLESVASGQL
jgi:glycine/D-amino acid oxidase-like deaminating enzyme